MSQLKIFSIVFTSREEDALLKITDFSLSRWLPPEGQLKLTQMCGSLEFISPEVLECTEAMPATDCWGVGVISYMLITGGRSPFYGGNRFRTMAKILTAKYEMNNMSHISREAKDFIQELLLLDPEFRMTANDCLSHPWLTTDADYVDILRKLETGWMKQVLARRRWQRWYNAVRAMQRIRKFSAAGMKGKRRNDSEMTVES
jgi:serine/threonine protein kinase